MIPDRQTIAHLRHELRTPLNHIIGYGEMLLEDVEGSPLTGLAEHLQRILADAKRMLGYVNEFLAPAKVEAGMVNVEHLPLEMTAPLDSIVADAASLGALATAGGSSKLLRDLERISGAAEHLRDIIKNGVVATLRSGALAAAGPTPVAARDSRQALPDRAGQSAILVVDDNENNREMLSRRLAREGYKQVTIAKDGRQALDLLGTQPFDLVLLDVMMPVVDGYQVLQTLKADSQRRDIPVIMISALDEMESVIRCIELGAEDYLPKPFDATLLRARVGASLEKKALRDEVHQWATKLEERVQQQVAQIDRLGRLKGFFSPKLAEAIVEGGGEDLLKTHRREVVVVFLDLRGFTAFTDSSEPEEVMSVLGEYHRAVGQLVMAHEGTLERFAGDGLMIFFNDPIKLENPVLNAVKMALDMQKNFAPLRTAWRKRGFSLDLGIGIAQGYATLGTIGFEGRWDYACIGSVTNLAARLCGEAKGGQILTNQKTLARIEDAIHFTVENAILDFTGEETPARSENVTQAESLGEMTLKGIAQPVSVFNITGVKA